jgi:hypothetical protein
MTLDDNAESVAVVIGNRDYRRTVPVDYAHNDADAMRDFLVRTLGFREQNVVVLKDATYTELADAFGTDSAPQSGLLWRRAREGRSHVFVYYSGHGVPDLQTRQAFLLPSDGFPDRSQTGYPLEALYRNLEVVKRKVGPARQVVVMIDACFTGETRRKNESLLAVSAPGFAPARPRASAGIVKLVASSGTTPANWDERAKLGLFTSRFLLGATGLALDQPPPDPAGAGVPWSRLRAYVAREVEEAARGDSGREQVPEIDEAPLVLPLRPPVPAIRPLVEAARDDEAWRKAERQDDRAAYEDYIAGCAETCRHKPRALELLVSARTGEQRETQRAPDREAWLRLSRAGRYRDYLDTCVAGSPCAYRAVAEAYLGPGPAAPRQAPTAPLPPPEDPGAPGRERLSSLRPSQPVEPPGEAGPRRGPDAARPRSTTWRVSANVSDGVQHVRAGPGTKHPLLFSIPAGSGGIELEQCRRPDPGGGQADWCLATWRGRRGWLSVNGLIEERG